MTKKLAQIPEFKISRKKTFAFENEKFIKKKYLAKLIPIHTYSCNQEKEKIPIVLIFTNVLNDLEIFLLFP